MKKILIALALLLGLTTQVAMASSSYFSRHTLNSATGTTTLVYMTPGTATSTITFNSADVDLAGLFINLKASTTASILNWKYQYSNNNIDWYDEDVLNSSITLAAGDTKTQHASSTVTHFWTPANSVSSTTQKMLILPSSISGWTRIVFSLPAGSANAALYAEVVAKRLPQ